MIRKLTLEEISEELFSGFHRHQQVTKCWRKRDGNWVIVDNPFVEEWTKKDYRFLVECLCHTVAAGGVVYGYFESGVLKGFASVEPEPFGSRGQYLELSSLHVSEELRGRGIGRALLSHARQWAGAKGAEKLYISAHSSVESQAFYRAVGCREAEEYSRPHVEKEPCDCQLECGV
ncbi:MAG: GNAT family N-acetyltransferase [Candidatus Faecousia sp.]|nr:GNAT family N-acetyltransferase [Candidatus Faecousia sp.]